MKVLRHIFCLLFNHRWRYKKIENVSGFAHPQLDNCKMCGKESIWIFHKNAKYHRYVEYKR